MKILFSAILLSIIFPLFSFGAEKCDVLLDKAGSCEHLARQKELIFSDGTKLINPLFKDENGQIVARSEKEVADAEESLIDAKVELLHLMESKKEKFSPRFRAQMMAHGNWALDCLFTDSDDLDDEVGFNDQIPWPATDNKASLKRIKPKELKSFLKSQFSTEELGSVEEKYKQSKIPKPNSNLKTLEDPSAKEVLASQKKAEQKITNLFKQAKESILQKILKGRSVKQLSQSEKSLYDKVSTVRLDLSSESQRECTRQPNASYLPVSHSLTICPSFYSYPEATLLGVIAHEIGHSIDPCRSQFPLLKVDENSLFGNEARGMIGDSDESDRATESNSFSEEGGVLPALWQLQKFTDKGPYSIPDFPISLDDYPATLKKLKSKYKVEEVTSGVSEAQNPFKKVKECLKQQGFRSSSMNKIDQELDEYYRDLPKKERVNAVAKDKAILSQYPECIDLEKAGELNEAFSDYLASEVLADYYEKNKPKNDDDRLAPVLFLLNTECSKPIFIRSENGHSYGGLLGVAARVRAGIEGRFNDPHPPALERARKITYASPRLAKALGCEPGEAKECFDPKLVPPQAASGGSSSAARKGTK